MAIRPRPLKIFGFNNFEPFTGGFLANDVHASGMKFFRQKSISSGKIFLQTAWIMKIQIRKLHEAQK
jgi:hypothetical protein